LVPSIERDFESSGEEMSALAAHARDEIWSWTRDADGRRRQKQARQQLFLEKLIPHYAFTANDAYDIHVWDFVGHTFQGCCIDRKTRTICVGARSNKGYAEVTRRPFPCLAKTIAHELGHALGLGHPSQRRFPDGVSMTLDNDRSNLMSGGADLRGGGGTELLLWQVMLCRKSAKTFIQAAEACGF